MCVLKKSCIVIAAAIFCSCILLIDNGVCEDQDIKTAENQDIKAVVDEKKEPARDANNIVCPVSDDDIIPEEAVKYEYKGKIYNFCCEACAKHFKKYPDKFVYKLTTR